MQPVKLSPAYKDYIWGGVRLREDYGFDCPLPRIAEAWVLSCHQDGQSRVTGGEFDGKTLSDIIARFPEWLGERGKSFPEFPMLIKLIDAKEPLSVQVHPSDEYARLHENQPGKTEMWYVVDCDEGASLYYGFRRELTKQEFISRIENNTLTEVLNKVPVHKGDVFFIEAGTIHAIGAGILIAEVQQSSNCTYRVYDYGRRGADGKPRPLHIDKAADVARLTPPRLPFGKPSGDIIADCRYFKVRRVRLNGEKRVCVGKESFSAFLCVEGEAFAGDISLRAGECAFVPAGFGELELSGCGELLECGV